MTRALPPTTHAERQALCRDRKRKKGMVRVEFWVPGRLAETVKGFVASILAEDEAQKKPGL